MEKERRHRSHGVPAVREERYRRLPPGSQRASRGHDQPGLSPAESFTFFCGFSLGEIAARRTVFERTVLRHWEKTRLYLRGSIPAFDPACAWSGRRPSGFARRFRSY